jgi:hypothetical protein
MKNLTLHSAALLAVLASAAVFAQDPVAAPADADPNAPAAGLAPAPATELPASPGAAPAPVPEDPAGLPGAGGPPRAMLKPPPVPAPPRANNVPVAPPAPGSGFLRAVPVPGSSAAVPPPPPPAGDYGYGGASQPGPAFVKPAKKFEYHIQKHPEPDKKPLTVVTKEKSVLRGEDIIRDTKLRVYQRHYETVLNEAIQARLQILDAPPEKQDALKARQAALEEIAAKLETDIRELSGPARVSALMAPGGGAVIVGEPLEARVLKEVHVGPAGGGGVVELHDEEGNTLRLPTPPVKR